MPNKNYEVLNNQQIGRYGEIYALMEFLSYGIDAYTTQVDDHGVDLVVKSENGVFCEIQVKALYKSKYVCFNNEFIEGKDGKFRDNYYICLILLKDNEEPAIYLIPTAAWEDTESGLFANYEYEYGISISNKNFELLEQYSFEKSVNKYIKN